MNDFINLAKSLNILKDNYDVRINEIYFQTENIRKKINCIQEDINTRVYCHNQTRFTLS